ncbi:MAG TPA: hypothetical protein VGM27_11320 [Acidobacteriaceae bacterium]
MSKRFVLNTLLLAGSVAAAGQSTTTAIAPPLPPLLIAYRYWPDQFVQWVGPELPYSLIELYADQTAPEPLYDVALTDRGTGKRIHYSNQQQQVDIDKLSGEAYLTKIQLAAPDQENAGGTWNLTFTTESGKPVIWRFIQGSDVTEQGSGLTPMPTVPMPLFMYREQGAVAGQGTALQVGSQVSEADVWTEISHPPYFVAYHAAHAVGLDVAVLQPGTIQWKIESAPATVSAGAAWKLSSGDGKRCTLTVEKAAGNIFTIVAADEHSPGRAMWIEAEQTPKGWLVQRLRYAPQKQSGDHGFAMSFEPGLPVGDQGSFATVKFEMQAGKKTKIGTGTLTQQGNAAHPKWLLEVKTPDWARTKSMLEDAVVTPNSLQLQGQLQSQAEAQLQHKPL